MTARYETALRKKHHDSPTPAISAGQRRADDPGPGHHGAVQAHGVREVPVLDHLGEEALPRGLVDRGGDALKERERVDHPELDDPGRHDGPQSEREHAEGHLRREQDPPLVVPIGERPTERSEQQDRPERERGVDPEGDPAAGQLEHQPRGRDHLHPRAGDRDRLPDEEPAEVLGMAERVERPMDGQTDGGHVRAPDGGVDGTSVSRSRISAAASRVRSSSGSSERSALAR